MVEDTALLAPPAIELASVRNLIKLMRMLVSMLFSPTTSTLETLLTSVESKSLGIQLITIVEAGLLLAVKFPLNTRELRLSVANRVL